MMLNITRSFLLVIAVLSIAGIVCAASATTAQPVKTAGISLASSELLPELGTLVVLAGGSLSLLVRKYLPRKSSTAK